MSNDVLPNTFITQDICYISDDKDEIELTSYTPLDTLFLLFFIFLGIGTHFFRIQFPNTVVFDEVHFGSFINFYINGSYFHDIHPPLAKLIMASIGKLSGYNGEYDFTSISYNKNYPSKKYISLRIIPALFGSFFVPISYIIMRSLHSSYFASFIATIFLACENLLIIESRFILTDGILCFFVSISIFSIILYWNYQNSITFYIMSISIGLALSIKFTAGGILFLGIYIYLY